MNFSVGQKNNFEFFLIHVYHNWKILNFTIESEPKKDFLLFNAFAIHRKKLI